MRFSKIKPGADMRSFNEDKFRKDFEKAMKVGHIYGVPIKKGKRFRSAFTTEQVNYLEREFCKYPYIGNARRKDVANVLDIPERAVKIWFQNRRMKEKKGMNNKETESDKSMEVSDSYSAPQSSSDMSLPLLTTPTSHEEKEMNSLGESKHAFNRFKEPTSTDNTFYEPKQEVSVIQSNTTSTTTSEIPSSSSKQFKKEKSFEVFKKKLLNDPYEDDYQVSRASSSSYDQYLGDQRNLNHPLYVSSPSAVPQDLSSKPAIQPQKSQLEQTSSSLKYNPEGPFYLKEYYSPSYIPQGSMIWKPINMTPIMTSAPIQSISISSPGLTSQDPSLMKKNCNCDCHKPYLAPVIVPNNPHANVQYVITAVPLQNPSPKY